MRPRISVLKARYIAVEGTDPEYGQGAIERNELLHHPLPNLRMADRRRSDHSRRIAGETERRRRSEAWLVRRRMRERGGGGGGAIGEDHDATMKTASHHKGTESTEVLRVPLCLCGSIVLKADEGRTRGGVRNDAAGRHRARSRRRLLRHQSRPLHRRGAAAFRTSRQSFLADDSSRPGFTPRLFHPSEQRELLQHGCGITNVVARATTAAAELTLGGAGRRRAHARRENPPLPSARPGHRRHRRVSNGIQSSAREDRFAGRDDRRHAHLDLAKSERIECELPSGGVGGVVSGVREWLKRMDHKDTKRTKSSSCSLCLCGANHFSANATTASPRFVCSLPCPPAAMTTNCFPPAR